MTISTSARPATRSSSIPTDWAPASERHWHVALRCPECEWNGGGSYSQDIVDRLDEALDQRHRVGARGSDRPRPGQHGRPDRALRLRPPRGPDPPRGLLGPPAPDRGVGVALDDAVGDQLEQPAALGSTGRAFKRALGQLHPPARAGPDLVEDARRGDPVADAPRRPRRRAPRRSSSASEASRSRARIRGRVTVPSSRSVPRALPVRSGGPVTSRTSSRSWKARPISRPKVRRAPSASAAGAHLGVDPSDQAGALEQARRLQLAALAGSAPRRSSASKASRRWASSPSARATDAVGQQLDLPPRCRPRRARRRRARTAGRRPPARASRPERATTVGLAAPKRRRVEHVVVDEGRHVDQLDRGRGPDRHLARPRPGAEQDQHRAQPLAAGVERRPRASAASVSPWPSASSRSRSSTASMRAGSQASAASSTSVTGGGTMVRFTSCLASGHGYEPPRRPAQPALAAEWIAMIPPASTR